MAKEDMALGKHTTVCQKEILVIETYIRRALEMQPKSQLIHALSGGQTLLNHKHPITLPAY